MPDKQKKVIGKQKQQQFQIQAKEGNLIWFAAALIAVTAIIIWLANSLAPSKGIADDMLVRKTIRDQYETLFALNTKKFLSYYSREFNNGDYTYDDKVSQVEEIAKVPFEVKDFYIEFIKSGTDPEKKEVHIDNVRGFASTYVYTYWKQRGGGSITLKPVQQLGAFLLRKEGTEWRIVSEKSVVLQKREDAEHLIATAQFKPFMDPSTIVWPPPEPEVPPATKETVPAEEQGQPDDTAGLGSEPESG